MTICYIGIGSNLGDRHKNIGKAIQSLGSTKGIILKRTSSIYETEPMGGVPQGKFLNGVLEIETDIRPKELLGVLNAIEESLGRKRTVKNGPRTMDLDILYYGDEIIAEDNLVVPHPKIEQREFVLKGLRELKRAE
ncbi:MAG: 2-amino-4-hydroxy-6-hydroxymethyldihydropteridine diphosphokinase [Candidatus Omnitrophica bacterium]|nr:2-amino-4-hydroxy-6-hydroxymethyldihydropteridine diphosphokinase [Candidatus Omnitrophota bacterium]